jgi:hypothetical protein
MSRVQDKLRDVFSTAPQTDLRYDGQLEKIDYYGLFCKAAAKERLFKIFGNNSCMFNTTFENEDAVMMIFSIPINPVDDVTKSMVERTMEIVESLENCFIKLDFLKSEEVNEDKYVYITAIKKTKEETYED